MASCDIKVPLKLKGNFYRTAVSSLMLYKTRYCMVKNQHENKVSVVEMRMLCWIYGKTRHNKIKNDNIRECWVTPIVEKMVENGLEWFEYVERRSVNFVVSRVYQMEKSQTIRGRRRQ